MYIESLVGYPESVIRERAAGLLGRYNIDYAGGYVFCGNSNEAYCEIADIFYDMKAEMENALKDALDNDDARNYAVNVHALKSNARSLGINGLADMAYEHELKSKAGDMAFCRDNWDRLIGEWNRSLSYLAVYLKAMNIDKGDNFEAIAGDGACGQMQVMDTDDLMGYRDYQEAKLEIQSLIDSGMEDIARQVIDELVSEETDPVKIEQLKGMIS